jgi:hypothetical protein
LTIISVGTVSETLATLIYQDNHIGQFDRIFWAASTMAGSASSSSITTPSRFSPMSRGVAPELSNSQA